MVWYTLEQVFFRTLPQGMIVSSHEVVALWGNATQMIHRLFTVSETALATMTNSYSIFSHAFSLVAVTGCIVYGVQKNRTRQRLISNRSFEVDS